MQKLISNTIWIDIQLLFYFFSLIPIYSSIFHGIKKEKIKQKTNQKKFFFFF